MKVILAAVLLLSSTLFAAELQSLKLVNGQAKQWLHFAEISPALIDGKLIVADREYEAPNARLFQNINNTRFALQSFSQHDKSGKISLAIFESYGKRVGRFSENLVWDQPVPRFEFAGTQSFLYRIAMDRTVRKVSFQGEVLAEFEIPVLSTGSETNIICRVDAGGHLYIAIVRPRAGALGMNWQTDIFRLADGSFSKLFSTEKSLTTFAVSADGALLACSVFEQQDAGQSVKTQSVLVNASGEMLATLGLPFRDCYFYDDHILLMDRYRVALVERKTGKELWRSAKNETGFINLAALRLNNGQIVVHSGRISDAAMQNGNSWSYQPVRLSVFNSVGKLLEKKTLKDVQVFEPSLAPAVDGRSVFFGHSKGWTVFSWSNDY